MAVKLFFFKLKLARAFDVWLLKQSWGKYLHTHAHTCSYMYKYEYTHVIIELLQRLNSGKLTGS